ncbi:hypothetical protein HMPREF0724_14494 [Prescottella equi ATCC 33707]|uniref:Uncharacterized protein n=1 Tax=Prescottella equi ATCC 33707 TaxID=525370 RepID=E9T6T8_RHOHA|nr:hypothetical protein HMPREF0724_14494 [Prescottella equi ATCC 33707]
MTFEPLLRGSSGASRVIAVRITLPVLSRESRTAQSLRAVGDG